LLGNFNFDISLGGVFRSSNPARPFLVVVDVVVVVIVVVVVVVVVEKYEWSPR